MLSTAPGLGSLLTVESPNLLRRFTESAATGDRSLMATDHFHEWFAGRVREQSSEVSVVPLHRMAKWSFQDGTGNLVHDSGRFYAIEGLAVNTDHREVPTWTQPIIIQPEIGILGILVKEFRGVLHFLMQVKTEPGNVNRFQLSPTVQATKSNYTRVHDGNPIPYLEHFVFPRRGRVLVDALQSEQGSWFLRKRNRNMVVEVHDDVLVHDDFCWLTLGQLRKLLLVDNLVNMDARTVLSMIAFAAPVDRPSLVREDSFRGALLRSLSREDGALHDMASVLSWFTELKSRHLLAQRRIPLDDVTAWHLSDDEIAHESGRFFRVIGVQVQASSREVRQWSQPLLAPQDRGVLAFLAKQIDGVLHLLVQARTEAGTFDVLEMAPTVHCTPNNYSGAAMPRPPYLDYVLSADPARIRCDVVHSEEGGRLYQAQNRYLIIEVEDGFPIETPDDYLWMTVNQVNDLVRYGNHFNIEVRSLLTCLHALW
jgi:oxidase EvaA